MNRLFDIVIAAAALAVLSPLIAVAAVAIRLETRGGAFFRQRRVGAHGEPFELWKLRTMVTGAEGMGAGIYVLEGDSRITRVGSLLRRYSLDELPNLFNVLKGDLAIVGPRPTVQEQVDAYTDHQRRRLEVRPGITGWAQINYKYGDTLEDTIAKLEYDLYYIKNMSWSLDTYIIFHTMKAMLLFRGAQ